MKKLEDLDHKSCQEIKLIATDFDGTLTENGKLTARAIGAISQLSIADLKVIIVTGRSAGWVEALYHYLPVDGAIAENGGLYYSHPQQPPDFLVPIPNLKEHRNHLATIFEQLQDSFPHLQESSDNPFRFTDWTFDVAGLSIAELGQIAQQCQDNNYSFTYSTVQCHIKPQGQDKAKGLTNVLKKYFPEIHLDQVITIGDSPNDESLFNAELFPFSVGVANIKDYVEKFTYSPQYVTEAEAGKGFCELADHLIIDREH